MHKLRFYDRISLQKSDRPVPAVYTGKEFNMKDQVLQKINALNDAYVQRWIDIVNLESPTHSKAGVDSVGEYFIRYATERGWKVEVFEQPVAGNVVTVTMNADVDAAPLALSGHMDTVHEIGSFGSPAARVEGDTLYGPGTTDCKGGIVAGFLAMEALDACGYRKRPVVMYLQSDEEGGGKYSGDATINHICDRAVGSIAFLNLEGGGKPQLCIGRKGIATFEFTVEGVEGHAAGCATHGSNAILEAAYKIIELEKFKDKDGLTCCCAIIHGGTKHNIVPGKCEFKANVRFANKQQLEEFTAFAEDLCKDIKVPGCTCRVVLPRVRPAMERCDRNVSLAERLNEIWQDCGLDPYPLVTSIGGSDAANVSDRGIPTVDSLGTFGGKIHSVYEFGTISSLAEQAKRLALAALYL